MEEIKNTVLRAKLRKTLYEYLSEHAIDDDEIRHLSFSLELDVMTWVAEQGLKPSDKTNE